MSPNRKNVHKLKEKDYEVLFMTDDVDEFVVNILMNHREKQFKNITSGDLDLSTEKEKNRKRNEETEEAQIEK